MISSTLPVPLDSVTNTSVQNSLNGLSAITVCLWVKSDVTGQDRGIFIGRDPNNNDDNLGLRYDAAGWAGGGTNLIKAAINTSSGPIQVETISNTQTTDWQHLALVWNATDGRLRVFINGAESPLSSEGGVRQGATVSGTTKFILGRDTKNKYWDGHLDDVRIYANALTPGQIAAVAGVARYTYDALGRRVQKTAAGHDTVYALNDGWQVLEEFEDGTLAKSYAYGAYIDEPLMVTIAGDASYWYHRNHLYSVAAITDDQGVVQERYTYDAYGKISVRDASGALKSSQVPAQPYGYTGRRLDGESKLWYFRARYFDDQLGRFISRDPFGYGSYINLYSGKFIPNKIDPSGSVDVDAPPPPIGEESSWAVWVMANTNYNPNALKGIYRAKWNVTVRSKFDTESKCCWIFVDGIWLGGNIYIPKAGQTIGGLIEAGWGPFYRAQNTQEDVTEEISAWLREHEFGHYRMNAAGFRGYAKRLSDIRNCGTVASKTQCDLVRFGVRDQILKRMGEINAAQATIWDNLTNDGRRIKFVGTSASDIQRMAGVQARRFAANVYSESSDWKCEAAATGTSTHDREEQHVQTHVDEAPAVDNL